MSETMLTTPWLRKLFLKDPAVEDKDQILACALQIKAWRRANRRMDWFIRDEEFEAAAQLQRPSLTDEDRSQGFAGTVLFYGFGDDGSGGSDAVLSAKLAWEYACKIRRGKTWQCEYVDFSRPEDIRLRPLAPPRPRGFYFAKVNPGQRYIRMTVSQVRKKFEEITGLGPEGFQLLAISHPHFADLMTERKMPFMALADYDVAPHGFNDFYDAPQLFCSNHILGLGIGNVDRNYPLFGIPTLRFDSSSLPQRQVGEQIDPG